MTNAISTFEVHGRVFAGEASCLRNFRSANVRARDVRMLRILREEMHGIQTPLLEYRHPYRTYVNARMKHRRDERAMEQRQRIEEQPSVERTVSTIPIPLKGAKTVHGRWLDGRWWSSRAPGGLWPEGTFDPEGDSPFGPPGRMLAYESDQLRRKQPESPRLQRRPCGRLGVSTNHRPDAMVEFPGSKELINANRINSANRHGEM